MTQHTNYTTRRLLTAVGLSALLTAVPASMGQTRAGSDGRALDANQQVGSGGVNALENQVDYRIRNDVVTGNVGGGRAFQDDVGYGAVGEFQDNLGTDSLFNFRRQSLSSSPGYFNAATAGGVGQNVSVYRSFTNRAAQPQGPGLLIAPEGGGYQLGTGAGFGTIYTSELNTRFTQPRVGNLAPGQALQAFNRSDLSTVGGDALDDARYEAAVESGEIEPIYDPSSMMNTQMRFDTNVFDPLGKRETKTQQNEALQYGQLPPTLMIGQQLQTLVDPQRAGEPKPGRSQQVLDSVFKRLDDEDKTREPDAYTKLLRDIQAKKSTGGSSDAWTTSLDAPTSQQLTEAERAYDQIMKEMYGEDYKDRRRESKDAEDGEEVHGVVDQLNYDLPRLQTLASDKKTRVADLTREAEASLAAGKYLTAEARYRQIMLDVKDDPLPRVGLIHSQLGAGMFRSAGMNLRALFVQHPELIAAKYDAKLLPPEERLHWVQKELQTVISQGEGGKDAPLLMAYLGYQADSNQLVRYGLALAQSKSPKDPLLAIVREIWLDGAEASDDGK